MPEIVNNPAIDEARALVATLNRDRAGRLDTRESDLPSVVRLLALFTESGLHQRPFVAAVGLGLSTLTAWRAGCRRNKLPWGALTAALGREPYQPRQPSSHPHAAFCRQWRAARKQAREPQVSAAEVTCAA